MRSNNRIGSVAGMLAALWLMVAMLGATFPVWAQGYPNNDITLVVPYNPGGSTDALARQFATQLAQILKVGVNTENRPGGTGTIGMSSVVRAKPDGYTLGLASNSLLAFQPLANPGLPYKSTDDYTPIVKLIDQPNVLFVRAEAPWKTFDEFLAEAKKNPGKVRVAVAGLRGTNDLVMQQFNMVSGIKLVMVPFSDGASEATIALLGGRVEAMGGSGPSNLGLVQAGKLRPLAVFMSGRYAPFPDAVSIAEAGYPEATLSALYFVIAPKGVSKEVHDKLVAASLQIVHSKEWNDFAKTLGSSAIEKNGPEVVKTELDSYSKSYRQLLQYLDTGKKAGNQ